MRPLLVLSFLIGASSAFSFYNVTDLEVKNAAARILPTECATGVTQICKNCNLIVACLPGGTEQIITTCGTGETCMNGYCERNSLVPCTPPAAETAIPCSTVGVFPDPYSCTAYHVCVNPPVGTVWSSIVVQCENSNKYYYNPRTNFCDKKLTNGVCSGTPIPACKAGDTLPLRENPSLYYLCAGTDLYPYQFACANGGTFSASTKKCSVP